MLGKYCMWQQCHGECRRPEISHNWAPYYWLPRSLQGSGSLWRLLGSFLGGFAIFFFLSKPGDVEVKRGRNWNVLVILVDIWMLGLLCQRKEWLYLPNNPNSPFRLSFKFCRKKKRQLWKFTSHNLLFITWSQGKQRAPTPEGHLQVWKSL